MEDHNDSLMYASGGPLPSPALMPTLERRVLELEKRDAAQQELLEALARGFMGLIEAAQEHQTQLEKLLDVCVKQQTLIDGLDRHLEAHGNALASHGKVLAMIEAEFAVEDTYEDDEHFIDRIMNAIALCPTGLRLPRRPR